MKTFYSVTSVLYFLLVLFISPYAIAEDSQSTFSEAELDQMMAPIALYPDSLLSQMLMASTYPADVSEAVQWSKDNPGKEGDAAVSAVQEQNWDPSVMSLVAFPQVLDMMGQQPDWVQDVGDAFLASPDDVMDTIQKLRRKAKDEGNLKDTKEQKVIVESNPASTSNPATTSNPASTPSPTQNQTVNVDVNVAQPQPQTVVVEQPVQPQTVVQQAPQPETIIIQPAQPQMVYVPTYNPSTVYGSWGWPSYQPHYYQPPGYNFGSALLSGIGFGLGVAIVDSLWGDFRWGRHDIDVNVHHYNNINVNKRLNVNNRNVSWQHNANNRRGVPYRDSYSRQKYNKQLSGTNRRNDYRGRDNAAREAQRRQAQNSLKNRGLDPNVGRKKLSGSQGDKVRNQVNQVDRNNLARNRNNVQNRDTAKINKSRDTAKVSQNRNTTKVSQNRNTAKINKNRSSSVKQRNNQVARKPQKNHALSGIQQSGKTSRQVNRGSSSNRSMKNKSRGDRVRTRR